MKNKTGKSKAKVTAEAAAQSTPTVTHPDVLPEEAFLADADKEPKRILLADHIKTIRKLRDEKRLTFRAIADWFGARDVETDQSAVYRAYCASLPELDEFGHPVDPRDAGYNNDEDSTPSPDQYENATLKKKQN